MKNVASAAESLTLYKILAERARQVAINVPASHNTLFQPNESTEEYYQRLYLEQLGSTQPKRRPGGRTCQYCARFHLANLKNIDKNKDLTLGNRLEDVFQRFLQECVDTRKSGVICNRADQLDKHMPDFMMVRNSNKTILGYFELKVIFRPYIKIADYVDSTFECYSNSLTLDYSNGNKLRNQRDRVEQVLGVEKVQYVYWYDLPCLKGVFWMPAKGVYEIMDTQKPYQRKEVAGDLNIYGKRRAAINKLYLPLLEMSDFPSFLDLYT